MEIIAHIYNSFDEKFGIPRQSGFADNISEIRLEPPYNMPEALRGLETFSHIWLLWLFSENPSDRKFSPTVRPPRMGGNRRLGVFATRSPFRPNDIGLSCVELCSVDTASCSLTVKGADLMNGTPIIDIKPYIPFSDCRPNASAPLFDGITARKSVRFEVSADMLSDDDKTALIEILSQDPRPQYHNDERDYTFTFAGQEVTFHCDGEEIIITRIE